MILHAYCNCIGLAYFVCILQSNALSTNPEKLNSQYEESDKALVCLHVKEKTFAFRQKSKFSCPKFSASN